jgi:hypothetical protein
MNTQVTCTRHNRPPAQYVHALPSCRVCLQSGDGSSGFHDSRRGDTPFVYPLPMPMRSDMVCTEPVTLARARVLSLDAPEEYPRTGHPHC